VTSLKRFNSYEIFNTGEEKGPFNTGDHMGRFDLLIQVTAWAGLTVLKYRFDCIIYIYLIQEENLL
jgi:hypothetical protein